MVYNIEKLYVLSTCPISYDACAAQQHYGILVQGMSFLLFSMTTTTNGPLLALWHLQLLHFQSLVLYLCIMLRD